MSLQLKHEKSEIEEKVSSNAAFPPEAMLIFASL